MRHPAHLLGGGRTEPHTWSNRSGRRIPIDREQVLSRSVLDTHRLCSSCGPSVKKCLSVCQLRWFFDHFHNSPRETLVSPAAFQGWINQRERVCWSQKVTNPETRVFTLDQDRIVVFRTGYSSKSVSWVWMNQVRNHGCRTYESSLCRTDGRKVVSWLVYTALLA